jgi:hypothetical protein
MRRAFLAISASAVVLLSACVTNGGASLPSALGPENRNLLQRSTEPGRRNGSPKLYVSDPIGNKVEVYEVTGRNQQPIATITDGINGPAGLASDSAGNLYVANTIGNTVTVYAPNGSSPVATYSEDLLGSVDVAFDGKGAVYVANFYSFGDSIVEFRAGSTNPSLEIRNPGSSYSTGLTIDARGDLYVAYQNFYSQPSVYRYTPGSRAGTLRLNLCLPTPPNPRCFVAGLLIDKVGNLLVADGTLPGIEIFPPGKDKPSKVIDKTGSPQFLAFGSGERDLFVTDTVHAAVEEYSYPAGTLVDTITRGLKSVYGVTVSPAAAP